MAVTINLYPPIVGTYMPAFLINSTTASKNTCRVYFSLSQFNTSTQIKNVQIVVRNSSTNLSALNKAKYPSEIMIKDLNIDLERTTDDKYYIEIKPSDMINENFIIDQYYRVQLRFTSIDASDPPITSESQPLDDWLFENLLYFSEWSTVCLIRGISVPSLSIKGFEEGSVTTIYSTVAYTGIVGSLEFEDSDETESLKSYKVVLYNSDDKKLLESEEIFTSNLINPNEINYSFNYSFQTGEDYYFIISYTTTNLYSDSAKYELTVEQGTQVDLHIVCMAYPDEENGCMTLKITRPLAFGQYTGQVIVRRTDNKSDFTIWEDMVIFDYTAVSQIAEIWSDYTVESGIWYKYAIQGVDENGLRAPMVAFKEPVMMVLQHMYLVSKDKQLKLEFNPEITGAKQQINETKVEALGSKYPFIKRNGNLNYFTFSISALISALMDEDGTFTSKANIYQNSESLYNTYNEENNISKYSDFIYERFFRDKVREFLQDSEVKLFRSPTEGNYLIKLMNISYTPNQVLGRKIWSFSAEANEIDECTINNYSKYNIYTGLSTISRTGSYSEDLTPIKRITLINDISEFPEQGRAGVLYIYNKQLYIWNEEESQYQIISVPLWNDDIEIIKKDSKDLENQNILVTDGKALYQWDNSTESYLPISQTSEEGE